MVLNGGVSFYASDETNHKLTVSGFTITNGASYGISATGQRGSLNCINNRIIFNELAGIRFEGYGHIENNFICGNRGDGIVTCFGISSVVIQGNTIANNGGYGIDPACYRPEDPFEIVNCIIWDNDQGSLKPETGNDYSLSYCCVEGGFVGTGNIAPADGPGFVNAFEFIDTLANNPQDPTDEYGVIRVEKGPDYVEGEYVEFNNDGVARKITSITEDGLIGDEITVEPEFASPPHAGSFIHYWDADVTNVDEDWHITADSPCIDQGGGYSPDTDATDIDGNPRLIDCPDVVDGPPSRGRGLLNGYWKANKNWLEGDGRFTEHPAAAFHIPTELQNEPQNKGWKELEQLLKYTYDK